MPTSSRTLTFRAYVLLTALVWAGTSLLVLTLNCLVDPLWYFKGNQLTDRNFAFNERQAKLNQLLRTPGQYDCLIFGSSRTTLLPASAFRGYRCYNLSFSGGQIEDFIAFAEYLHHAGMRPKLLIVGVDGFNFLSTGRDAPNIPDYVLHKQASPAFLKTYLSMDSLHMSWRTVWGASPLPRYYDGHFEARIRSDAPVFRPEKSLQGEGLRRSDADERRKRGYRPDNAALYKKLISVFPEARAIGYVPPISAWHISDMEQNGVLASYIHALSSTAPAFMTFIDFSMPSPITSRTDMTYDGSHYHPTINVLIARALQTHTAPDWGVDMKQMRLTDLKQRYQMALNAFRIHQANQRPAHAQHD